MKLIQVKSYEEFVEKQGEVLEKGYRYVDVIGKKMYFWKGANQLIMNVCFGNNG